MTIKLVKGNDYVIVETGGVGEKRWKAKGYKPEKSEGDNGKPDQTGSENKPGQDTGKPATGQEGFEQTGSENNGDGDTETTDEPLTESSEQTGSQNKQGSKATDGNDKN